jgi:hypothetical protein
MSEAIAMPETVRIGWVHINSGWPLAPRSDLKKWKRGSLAPKDNDVPAEPSPFENLPYSVGLLQAYAQKHAAMPERYRFLLPIFRRMPVEQAVEQLSGAQVVGFSTYIWNMQLSLAIAQRLEEKQPETLIVFGGPQVPNRAEAFLRQHPYVDIVCHGEGERIFLAILEKSQTRDWQGIPSVSYLAADGSVVNHPQIPRMRDLSVIPSPYLEDVFEPLMRANPHQRWWALWETNRGCPFSCSFCDWGSAVDGHVYKFDLERLFEEVDWMAEHRIEAVASCDANFGILPRDLEIARYVARIKREHGYPRKLFQNNTKGATDRAYQVQKILAESGLNLMVLLSLQSTNPSVLENTKRNNMPLTSFQKLQRRFLRDGVTTYTEMILGLPGETYDSFASGVSQVIENGNVFIYNCLVLPNAEMGVPEYRKRFGIRSALQEYVTLDDPPLEGESVPEYQEIVIATDSMPKEDWAKAKAFWWMTDLLYFDRFLQIPFVLVHQLFSVGYRELIEVVCKAPPGKYPLLAEIQAMFLQKAQDIQAGGPEYFFSEEWRSNWWSANQFALIKLATEGELGTFYYQAEQALADFLQAKSIAFAPQLLHEAIELNRNLLRMPFHFSDLTVELSHNVWEFYRSALTGAPVPLEERTCHYRIFRTRPIWLSWEDWLEHVIFCYNYKGYYFYTIRPIEPNNTSRVGK